MSVKWHIGHVVHAEAPSQVLPYGHLFVPFRGLGNTRMQGRMLATRRWCIGRWCRGSGAPISRGVVHLSHFEALVA